MLTMSETQSPTPECISKRTSLSFTSPPSDISCKSFSYASPSPRQASLSFSSTNTCPLDYSTDNEVESLALLPISPVSPCGDEKVEHDTVSCASDPCNSNEGKAQELLLNDEGGDQLSRVEETCSKDMPEKETVVQDILQVPTEILTSPNSRSDCNKRNNDGLSALSVTSSNCFLQGMMLLIEKGADVNLVDAYGRSPLHLACENVESNEHHDCIVCLLKNGADTSIQGEFEKINTFY